MARRTTDLTTYDLYLRSLSLAWGWSKEGVAAGIEILGRAIARDPHYAPVLALSAAAHTNLHVNDWTDDPAARARPRSIMRRRALACDDDDPNVLGFVARTFGYFGRGYRRVDRPDRPGPGAEPSFARGWVTRGWLRLWAGPARAGDRGFRDVAAAEPECPAPRIG